LLGAAACSSPSAPTSPADTARSAGGQGSELSTPTTPSATPSAQPAGKRVEFNGTVESITPPTLTVSGRPVVTNADTKIKRSGNPITLADLKVGDQVEVEGTQQADGSVLASKIKFEDDDNQDENENENENENPNPSPKPSPSPNQQKEVEFTGAINSVTPPTLVVAGRPVTTDGSTRIRRDDHTVPLSDLKPGEKVEVEGVLQSS